ncbi:MAG: cell division protein FtsA [Candidatus Omnitrophica bacterium]|nr:cell division protein FtsA [Candidatus Omnitrophota bacterium]
MLNNYICAIELGSSKISAVLARVNNRRISKLFFDYLPSKGIKNGSIINSTEVIDGAGRVLKNLKNKSGINIKSVYTNISGADITFKQSHAIIPLAERGNKVITRSDIDKVNEQARILGSNLEDEIIHTMPISYGIDSKKKLISPQGLYSHNLEVDLLLICAKLSSMQSITRVINQSGYEVRGLAFSPLTASKAIFNQDSGKKGLSLFCDIGTDKTELLVFKDGLLQDLVILPHGGNCLTTKLKEQLNLPFDLAEDIKRSYGIIADPEKIPEDKEILVKKDDFYKPIKQRVVSEIIRNEAQMICSKIKEAIEKKVKTPELSSFIVTGRTVSLEGFIETLENTLTVPVKLGRIASPHLLSYLKEESALNQTKSLTYLTSLGMICEVLGDKRRGLTPAKKSSRNLILRAANRVKEVYQEYF